MRTRFTPRQTRALEMLKPGHWITREHLDREAGASNSPDLIQQLRGKLGRDGIEMELYDATDRDGKPTRPGRYRLTQQGRERLCYSYRKPKGPVCEDTISVEVAAPTVKRGIVMSEFDRRAPARAGMVLGRWAIPRGWPHGYGRVFNICPPDMREGVSGGFQSLVGAETMTKVIPLARTAAPIISIASRRAAPIQSPADTTDPQIIGLHIAAENALASALHLLRSIDCDPAKLQAATGRAIRAATMLKRLSAAQAEGGAA